MSEVHNMLCRRVISSVLYRLFTHTGHEVLHVEGLFSFSLTPQTNGRRGEQNGRHEAESHATPSNHVRPIVPHSAIIAQKLLYPTRNRTIHHLLVFFVFFWCFDFFPIIYIIIYFFTPRLYMYII